MGHTLPCICQASMGNVMGRNWHWRCQGWGRVLPCACAPSLLKSPARIVARWSKAEVVFCGRGAPLGKGGETPPIWPKCVWRAASWLSKQHRSRCALTHRDSIPKHCGTLVASLWLMGHSRLGSRFFQRGAAVQARCCAWEVLLVPVICSFLARLCAGVFASRGPVVDTLRAHSAA